MNRKDFFKALWVKYLKPVLLLGVLIFSFRFLLLVFTQNGAERWFSIFALVFLIILSGAYLIKIVLKGLATKIKSNLSEKSLQTVDKIGRIIDFFIPIALGIVIYKSWQENNLSAIIFFGAFLIKKIFDVVRNEN
jgi:hypothetical protein